MLVTELQLLDFFENCMLLPPWLLVQRDILTTQIAYVCSTVGTWISHLGYSISCLNSLCTIAVAVYQAVFGQGTGPIFLHAWCTGTESSLLNCSHSGIGVTYCSHSYDAGVVCPPRKWCIGFHCVNGAVILLLIMKLTLLIALNCSF